MLKVQITALGAKEQQQLQKNSQEENVKHTYRKQWKQNYNDSTLSRLTKTLWMHYKSQIIFQYTSA